MTHGQTSGEPVGLQSLEEEVESRPLAVDGRAARTGSAGTLVRVTPALLDPGGMPLRHWFDGLAMLNAFTIADGGVSYASRFLDSQAYRNVREHGETRACAPSAATRAGRSSSASRRSSRRT